jgi:hypothetical protein
MSCVYCGQTAPLTREHIWPKCLHDAGDYSLKYHSKPDKVLPSEHVIKDVCSKCNNGPLSELDSYAKSLHQRYFNKDYQSVKKGIFRYDFEKLSKLLLKISYDSARAAGSPDSGLLSLYAPCIIASGCSPVFSAFTISLMGQLIKIDRKSRSIQTSELRWCRSGPVALLASEAEIVTARVIIINTWCFRLIVMKNGVLRAGDESIVMPQIQGAIIRPDSTPLKVPTIPLDSRGILKHYRDKESLYPRAVHGPASK